MNNENHYTLELKKSDEIIEKLTTLINVQQSCIEIQKSEIKRLKSELEELRVASNWHRTEG